MKGLCSILGFTAVSAIAIIVTLLCLSGDAGGATTYLPSPWVITTDTVLRDGTFQANSSIEVQEGTLTLEDAELILGWGSDGWELMVDSGAGLVARRSTIRGNMSYWSSADLYGDTLLDNTTVSRFSSIDHLSGALVADHATFSNNRYTIMSQSGLVVRASTFMNNLYSNIEWEYAYDGIEVGVLVVDSHFQGNGDAVGLQLSGPGYSRVDVTAVIRGCTFYNLYRAVTVNNFLRYGSVDIHDNYGDACGYGLYLQMSEVVRVSWNQWSPLSYGDGIYVHDVYMTTNYVGISNETVIGGDRAVLMTGYGDTLVLRDMNISSSEYGVSVDGGHVDIYDSVVLAKSYDFLATDSAVIHVSRCTHSHKGYAYYGSLIAEIRSVNVRSVTWQSGLSIDTGLTEITNDTGYVLASRNNEKPTPIELPVWMIQYDREVTIDRVRGAFTVRGVRFLGLPVSIENKTEISIIIIDDRPPTAMVLKPRPGDVFRTDMIQASGYCDDIGAGLYKVEVAFAEGPWKRAALDPSGAWFAEMGGLPDDVGELRVRVSDVAWNVNETAVGGITVDTEFPTIELIRPAGAVSASPVTMVAITEPHSRAYVDEIEVPVMDNGAFQATVELVEGENTVGLRVVDAVGNTVSRDVSILMDSKPPVLRVDSPADGAWVRTSTVAVVGVVSESVELTVGDDVRSIEAGAFQVNVPLTGPVMMIVITAQDGAGNYLRESRIVHQDRDLPQLEISSPSDGERVNTGSVTVVGTVADAGTVAVSLDGRPASIVEGTWFCDVALADGENLLRATAVDAAGNMATASVLLVLDRTAPSASFWLVIDGTRVDPTAGAITTRALDVDIGLWLDEACTATVGERTPVVFPAGTSTFNLPLVEGPNDVRVALTDEAGNMAPQVLFQVTVDTTPPALALDDSGLVTTRDATVAVRGTSEPGCHVLVEDMLVEVLGDGSFAAVVQLDEGSNLIEVVAVDAAGNRAEKSLVAEREVVATEGGDWDARSQGILVGLVIGIVCALVAAWLGIGRQGVAARPVQGPPRSVGPGDEGPVEVEPDDALRTEGSTLRVVRRGR